MPALKSWSLLLLPLWASTLLVSHHHQVQASQHPFHLSQFCSSSVHPSKPGSASCVGNQPRVRKVAIIGAGPTGTSAAYFLKKAQDVLAASGNETIEVSVFERNQRIGGRTAVVYPYDDKTYDPVELGASIYASVNYNLRRAVKEFGLQDGAQNSLGEAIGVWDGQQFAIEGDASSWWTSAKFLARYGFSPMNTQKLVWQQVDEFVKLYDPSFLHSPVVSAASSEPTVRFPWKTVDDLASDIKATDLVHQTAQAYFRSKGISQLFIQELIEGATRVNYAQDTNQIHGFGAIISLAASGATGVKQGNYRIFEEFLSRSAAKVYQGEKGQVTGIFKFNSFSDLLHSGNLSSLDIDHLCNSQTHQLIDMNHPKYLIGTKDGESRLFDAVIIATPWHNADISLINTVNSVSTRPFVHLHVTLLTTNSSQPNPKAFDRSNGNSIPTTIFTSDESSNTSTHPWFYSLTYLRSLSNPSSKKLQGKQYLVKLFSQNEISNDQLNSLFGSNSNIDWIYKTKWDSYPYLNPLTSSQDEKFPKIQIDHGVYFPNAIESLVSTMETSTVSAKNSVALLLNSWFGSSFGSTGKNCNGTTTSSDDYDPMDSVNWAGWGCNSG